MRKIGPVLIICVCLNAYAQQKIIGEPVVSANSKSIYSINGLIETIKWTLNPPVFGKIIQGQGSQKITVQWNLAACGLKENSKCAVIATIRYPNAENIINVVKEVEIKNKADSSRYVRKNLNSRFSKTTRDSLRYFFKVSCDSSVNSREVTFTDSSLQKTKAVTVNWIIKAKNNTLNYTGNTKTFNLTLKPGKYSVTLQKQNEAGKKYTLQDTFTLYPGLRPSFAVSNQLPCFGTAVTFSNTSANQALALSSVFNFGDGSTQDYVWPDKAVTYVYENTGMQPVIFMSSLEVKDLYGCSYKSNEMPLGLQRNRFTLTNVFLEPRYYELKHDKDSVLITCVMGGNVSPPNPNKPYTYLWNTGQNTAVISVKERGEYRLVVTDKYGCSSEHTITAKIVKLFAESNRPKITGPTHIKAGNKMTFKIETWDDCLYQWQFIYTNGQTLTTEPTKESVIIPAGWERSKPGTLKVIGIVLKPGGEKNRSIYSDTLSVKITDR